MTRRTFGRLCAALLAVPATGCAFEPSRVTLGEIQEDWPWFRALVHNATSSVEIWSNARDWDEALMIFGNKAELRAYMAAGWWAEFVRIASRDASFETLARVDEYDRKVREVLR